MLYDTRQEKNGRGCGIQTHDLLFPKQTRYQASLIPYKVPVSFSINALGVGVEPTYHKLTVCPIASYSTPEYTNLLLCQLSYGPFFKLPFLFYLWTCSESNTIQAAIYCDSL